MLLLFSVYWKEEEKKKPHKIKKSFVIRIISTALTYPLGMSESSLLPGSFSTCCLILSSRPEASAPWYWSTRTLFRKNRNVGVAEMLLAAAVPFETRHTNNVKPRKKKNTSESWTWHGQNIFKGKFPHLTVLSYIQFILFFESNPEFSLGCGSFGQVRS